MIIYECVPFHEVSEEIFNNVPDHCNDISQKAENRTISIDWNAYFSLSALNRCLVITARTDERLIAYSVFCINEDINHKGFIAAVSTAIFIARPYRGKITSELFRKSDDFLKDLGVDEINYTFHDQRIGRLLERVGYKIKEITWSK